MRSSIPSVKKKPPLYTSHRFQGIVTAIGIVLASAFVYGRAISDRDAAIARADQTKCAGTGAQCDGERAQARAIAMSQFEYNRNMAAGNGLWIILSSAYAFVLASRKDRESSGAHVNNDFLGAMLVFYEHVRHCKSIEDDETERFRATLHRVDREADEHEQIIPYVGWTSGDPKRAAGRSWPNALGLVGQAVRMEHGMSCLIADIDVTPGDEAGVRKHLIQKYGYSEDQAQKLCKGRVTSMVVPIRLGELDGPIVAVLYCDSNEPGFFSDTETLELAVSAASGIASLVKLRFPKGGFA